MAGRFYEAIEQDMPGFITQLMVFAVIAGALLVLVVSQALRAMMNVAAARMADHDLLDQWLVRADCLLGFAGEIGVNPDQRIQQDAQHLTDLTTILAIGLLQSTLLLASFTGVLWVLSEQVVFDFGNGPGYDRGLMVWCALAYSLGGSLLAYVGRPPHCTQCRALCTGKPICASRSCASTSAPTALCCMAASG